MGLALTEGTAWRPAALEKILKALHSAVHPSGVTVTAVGEVTLYPHQQEAVAVILSALRQHRGALLADPVGTGKTWSALGVARHYTNLLIVTPASLRPMWFAALQRSGRSARMVTCEALSRGPPPDEHFDLVIVDEAHHLRNPATRRYKALASVTRGAHVLLLSATPLHNRPEELRALCALFLGSGAAAVEPELLSRVICRRVVATGLELPRVAGMRWIRIEDTNDVLQRILALPPPIPPIDGGTAAALGAWVLVRQWCSSDGALVAALGRRLVTGVVMAHRLSQGRMPTKRELARWMVDGGAVQLTLALDASEPMPAAAALSSSLTLHLEAVRSLRDAVRAEPQRDQQRERAMREVLTNAQRRRAVLFTHSVDTARSWFRRLAPHFRAACLDGQGGRVSNGRMSRDEIIRAFRPDAARKGTASHRGGDPLQIDVLIATDVLSEGVDLHDAGLVVHLDLPWTMARLDQRVGRLRRIGSPHREVTQYGFQPPDSGEEVLHLLRRLALKARLADTLIGSGSHAFAPHDPEQGIPAPADAGETLRRLTRDWSSPPDSVPSLHASPILAAVWSTGGISGFLAAVSSGGEARLVGGDDKVLLTDPVDLARLLGSVTRDRAPIARGRADRVCAAVTEWLDAERSQAVLLADVAARSEAHRRVLRAITAALRQAPRAGRRDAVREILSVRELVLASTGIGAEQVMLAWLERWRAPTPSALATLAATLRDRATPLPPRGDTTAIIAVLLLLRR